MADDIKWNGNFVDLLWDSVPGNFKRIRAYTKMKSHLKVEHKISSDDDALPPLFKSGTKEMQERKKRKLSAYNNRNNPSGQDLSL